MANRTNHYEAAFEAFLRTRRIPYIAVDEAKRSLMSEGSLKSLDFIVSPPGGLSWLVDVKGRRFPSGRKNKTYWKNWATQDDLRSLALWKNHLGDSFEPAFVFAYLLTDGQSPLPLENVFEHHGQHYAFVAIRLKDYAPHSRLLSESWNTVSIPVAKFRELATSADELFTAQVLQATVNTSG